MIKEMNQIHKQHLYFGKEPYRPLMGPYYGLLCATDSYMELCPHVCYFRQIVDKEMVISE